MYPNMKEDHDNAPWYIKSSLPLHALAVAVSASYVVIGNPIFHEICFAAILVACVAQYSKFTSQNLAGHADEKVIRHKTQRMVLRAILLMIGAFGIWNIDNVACGKLRSARNSLFGPFVILSPFLQFHALWHVLTIAAADYTVAGIVYIWCQGHTKSIKSKMTYKLWGCFPLVQMEQVKKRKKRSSSSPKKLKVKPQ
jgi:hypothetical protein